MAHGTMKRLAAVAAVGLLGLTAGCGEVLHAGRVAKLNMEFENLQHDPSFGPVFTELKTDFPQDYEALRTRVIAAVADLNTEAEMEARAKTVAVSFVADFRRTHLGKAAQASDATLASLANSQLQMLQSLRTIDPDYCGRVAMGDMAGAADPSKEAQRITAASGVMMLKASREGIDHPIVRGQPSQSELSGIVAIMRKQGVEPARIQALFGGGGMASLSRIEQCEGGIDLFRAIGVMEPAARSRFMAFILAAAAGQPIQ